jgi:hypothetical protein
MLFSQAEEVRDKIRAKLFVGENIGRDVKVMVWDVEALVPGCGSTGPWMCQIVSGNVAGKIRDISERRSILRIDKTVACHYL